MKAEHLLEICESFPLFKKFLMMRAALRRSYFLKVFAELRHKKELVRKHQVLNDDGFSRGAPIEGSEEALLRPFFETRIDAGVNDADQLY